MSTQQKNVKVYTRSKVYKGIYIYKRIDDIIVRCWPIDDPARFYEMRWFEDDKDWSCTCPARVLDCAHKLYNPYKPSKKRKKGKTALGIFADAAKRTWVILPLTGKRVNAFDYFWTKGGK